MIKKSNIHILFASRLVYEKGVDILIDAIHTTCQSPGDLPKIIWHICGDGPEEDAIIDLTKLYPDQVLYHGRIKQARLAEFYREMDYLFMPSRFLETFGLTALESLACGTPVIGFSKGGLASFIPSELSLDQDDPISSLISILENPEASQKQISSIDEYRFALWQKNLATLMNIESSPKNILLLHDYREKIGGAEYYVESVEESLRELDFDVYRFGYEDLPLSGKGDGCLYFLFLLFGEGYN